MCGLVGVAGDIGVKEEKIFQQLLFIDTLRGPHSTGVFRAKTNVNDWETLRMLGSAEVLMEQKEFTELFHCVPTVLLGHNRFATKGGITVDNAHPFIIEDKIIGAHNGTLIGQHRLPDSKDFEVDSHNLYHSLHKIGLEKTYEKLDGAWALSWWNAEENSINFIRNDKRPLHMCYSEDRKTLFWASEREMLVFILNRNKVKYAPIFQLKTHQHYKLEIDGKRQPLNKLTVTDMSDHKYVAPPTVVYQDNKESAWEKPSKTSSTRGDNLVGKRVEVCVDEIQETEMGQKFMTGTMMQSPYHEVLCFFPWEGGAVASGIEELDLITAEISYWNKSAACYHISPSSLKMVDKYGDKKTEEAEYFNGHDGTLFNKDEYQEKISCGCCWCGDPVSLDDDLAWVDSDTFLCSECKEHVEAQEFIQ